MSDEHSCRINALLSMTAARAQGANSSWDVQNADVYVHCDSADYEGRGTFGRAPLAPHVQHQAALGNTGQPQAASGRRKAASARQPQPGSRRNHRQHQHQVAPGSIRQHWAA